MTRRISNYSQNVKQLNKRDIILLTTILAVATLLRFCNATNYDGADSDGARYIQTAYNITCGNWAVKKSEIGVGLKVDRLYCLFYPAMIALTNNFIDDFVLSAQVVSLASGFLTVIAVFMLALIIYDKNTAIFSCFLSAISLELVRSSLENASESLVIILMLISLVLFFHKKEDNLFLFFSSIFISMAYLTKPIMGLVAVILASYLAYLVYIKKNNSIINLAFFSFPIASTIITNRVIKSNVIKTCHIARNEVLPFIDTLNIYKDPTYVSSGSVYDFSMIGYVKSHPGNYFKYFIDSYSAGIKFLFVNYMFPTYVFLFLFVVFLLRFFSKRSKNIENEIVILLILALFPLIPSLVIVHRSFMPRMMLPVFPLFIILIAKSSLDIFYTLQKSNSKKVNILFNIFGAVFILGTIVYSLGGNKYPPHKFNSIIWPYSNESRKKCWKDAGIWINKKVNSATYISDKDDSGGLINSYIIRKRIEKDIDFLIKQIKNRERVETNYILLINKSSISKMRKFINKGNSNLVSIVREFRDNDYSCLLLKIV